MTAQEIRKAYLEFFKARGHAVVKRAPADIKRRPNDIIHRFWHAADDSISAW